MYLKHSCAEGTTLQNIVTKQRLLQKDMLASFQRVGVGKKMMLLNTTLITMDWFDPLKSLCITIFTCVFYFDQILYLYIRSAFPFGFNFINVEIGNQTRKCL